MTQEEFDRRISVVLKTAEAISSSDPVMPDGARLGEGGMSKSEALAFYEQLVEALDTRLEQLMKNFDKSK